MEGNLGISQAFDGQSSVLLPVLLSVAVVHVSVLYHEHMAFSLQSLGGFRTPDENLETR